MSQPSIYLEKLSSKSVQKPFYAQMMMLSSSLARFVIIYPQKHDMDVTKMVFPYHYSFINFQVHDVNLPSSIAMNTTFDTKLWSAS